MKDSLNWDQFKTINTNPTGSFENLCRNLFKRKFFSSDILLRSNPNHPGLEVDPIYSDVTNSKISFQAKFLSKNDYSQIKKSIKKVIKYYKYDLDVLYLYCNRDLDTSSSGFLEIKKLLNTANIEIKLITNNEILNQVIGYKDLYSYFFKKHTLDRKWFEVNCEKSIYNLGPRYNSDLNVKTEAEKLINIFVKDDEAINSINDRKKTLQENLLNLDINIGDKIITNLINEILQEIYDIEEINYYTIKDSLIWSDKLKNKFKESMEYVENKLNDIKDEKEKLRDEYKINKLEKDYYLKLNELDCKIHNLEKILYFYKELDLSQPERSILNNNTFILTGKAGNGKSHLLGNTCKKIIDNGDYGVLILGQTFINSSSVLSQIMENLGLDYSFDEFLDVLEFIGSDRNREVYIIIDAINESKYREIWKNGLSLLHEKINKRSYIKLIVSIKNGYENSVLEGYIKNKIKENKISKVEHFGFVENNLEITQNFFNYYNITFSPSDFLSFELTNPLFLTLYCKSYSEGEVNIFNIFKGIIDKTYLDVKDKLNLEEDKNILLELLIDMAESLYTNSNTLIRRRELLSLEFWSRYGLRAIDIIPILVKNGILIDYSKSDEEYYGFSYNLLSDYLQAKYLIKKCENINEISKSINYFLQIDKGKINNFYNIDLFNFICEMSFEKYTVDPVFETLNNLTDKCSINLLINKYIEGLSLRSSDYIDIQSFKKIITQKPINSEVLFKMLIENSLKPGNELNAEFLHNLLYRMDLNYRDSIWTLYINGLSYDEIRLYQIIKYIIKGKEIKVFNIEEKKLISILMTWLLTSSNRILRDKASKALIEILKDSVALCEYILRRFEGVNDPYVLQRLYGCIFGACTKNFTINKQEFKKLSEYIYESVFNKETVYPDILLRDYSRLTIEKYISVNGDSETTINKEKIFPPYKSKELPIVNKKTYYDRSSLRNNGINRIDFSMQPNLKGIGYGDFGRYVFQSALSNFENVDILNLYHYAMQYIIHDLGYTNEYFGNYDCSIMTFNRHMTKKVERIGKKYQWIAFYKILAIVSDNYKLKNYNEGKKFIGPWNPYVRDFDPTMNSRLKLSDKLKPQFTIVNKENFVSEEEKNEDKITEWKNHKANMFKESLVQSDNESREWIVLYNFKDAKSIPNLRTNEIKFNRSGAQNIWRISKGYFIKEIEFDYFRESIKDKNFWENWFPQGPDYIYCLFNREYYRSSAYKDEFNNEWLDYLHDTGEKEIIQRKERVPIFDNFNISFEYKEWDEEKPVLKKIADVLPAFHCYYWEEEYDASEEKTPSFYMPCKKLVNSLKIQQKIYDGYFYNDEDELIAYDNEYGDMSNRLLIRKDYLDRFLEENNYILFWTNIGEKRFDIELDKLSHSKWSGFTWYSRGKYYGDMSIQDD